MYEAFEFLETHPTFINKHDNVYGREYRFKDGYIHVTKETDWDKHNTVIHSSFVTPTPLEEARASELYGMATQTAERIRARILQKHASSNFYCETSNFYIPTASPEDWKHRLADPEKQWKTGYSARTLAYCWQSANDFPHCVRKALHASQIPVFENLEFVMGLPEHHVPLKGGSKPSQNDIFVLARSEDSFVSGTVEGKVDEGFGQTIGNWLRDASQGRVARFEWLCDLLDLNPSTVTDCRYQLLHRAASAVIEAKRFHAKYALMLVHSFSPTNQGYADYLAFADNMLNSSVDEPGIVGFKQLADVELYLGWVHGDESFLNM